jgi:hypothetical protein
MRGAKITLGLATVLLSSCALLSPEDPLTYLHFDAEASVDTGVVHYALFVTNGSRKDVTLYGGGCERGAGLEVYDLEGHLVYDTNPDPFPPDVICTADRLMFPIQGGETRRIEGRAWVFAILGSSLPEGPYRLIVKPAFDLDFPGISIPVGEFTLELESG